MSAARLRLGAPEPVVTPGLIVIFEPGGERVLRWHLLASDLGEQRRMQATLERILLALEQTS